MYKPTMRDLRGEAHLLGLSLDVTGEQKRWTSVTVTMTATGSKQALKVFSKRLGKQAKLYVSDLLPPILPGG
jgi:hypothetical protein